MSHVPYSSVVGSIMYAMVCTRQDISHAINVVSRYMANPSKEHWQAMKWILQYLRGTANIDLVYDRASTDSGSVIGFVGFDFASDLDKRKSLTGYVFTLYGSVINLESNVTINSCFVYYRGKVYGSNRGSEGSYLVEGFGW